MNGEEITGCQGIINIIIRREMGVTVRKEKGDSYGGGNAQ